jgi:hypothetical protein
MLLFLRRALSEANKEILKRVGTTVDVDLKTGGSFKWELAEPNLLAAEMIACSPALQSLYADALRSHPCSMERPWKMVVALDEYTPGDKHKHKNARKSMAFSFNFLELGAHALCLEMTWFTPIVLRSSVIGKAPHTSLFTRPPPRLPPSSPTIPPHPPREQGRLGNWEEALPAKWLAAILLHTRI